MSKCGEAKSKDSAQVCGWWLEKWQGIPWDRAPWRRGWLEVWEKSSGLEVSSEVAVGHLSK